MKLITQLHSETIYLVVLPILVWLYDKRFARYMTSVFLLGYWSNDVLKGIFHTARPSPNDVWRGVEESSPAFPSGHSQNPLMFWGALALHVKRTWITVTVAIGIFLIGFSRLYLGIHWPLDVVGGWAIGAIMLWGFTVSYDFWVGTNMKLGARLLCAVGIPVAAVAISMALGQAPALSTAKDAAGQFWIVAGAYLGFWVGSVLEEEFVGFDPRRGNVLIQIVKVVVGIVLLLAVKEGFKLFLPATALGDLIRYFCVAFVGVFVAPWVFKFFAPAAPSAGRTIAR
jgi:membrane-associated phospholipid phosphatase